MCGVVTRKYKEKDQDDDLAKAFQYFDEDGMGKISVCFDSRMSGSWLSVSVFAL